MDEVEKRIGVVCDHRITIKLKEKFYKIAIRPSVLYGTKC